MNRLLLCCGTSFKEETYGQIVKGKKRTVTDRSCSIASLKRCSGCSFVHAEFYAVPLLVSGKSRNHSGTPRQKSDRFEPFVVPFPMESVFECQVSSCYVPSSGSCEGMRVDAPLLICLSS